MADKTTPIYARLCWEWGWESHTTPHIPLGQVMTKERSRMARAKEEGVLLHAFLRALISDYATRYSGSNVDEDGWDLTPGREPREVGLPEEDDD